jgi:large-conductance mechanosensitive channel
LQINGNYCKLRNYTVLNEEHSEIRYYAKAVTILNLIVVAKILFIIIMEKLHERKT